MMSDATFYDRITTIYRFIKPFLDKKNIENKKKKKKKKKKKRLFLRHMEPLRLPVLTVCALTTQICKSKLQNLQYYRKIFYFMNFVDV